MIMTHIHGTIYTISIHAMNYMAYKRPGQNDPSVIYSPQVSIMSPVVLAHYRCEGICPNQATIAVASMDHTQGH